MSAEKLFTPEELRQVRIEDALKRRELYKGSKARLVRVESELAKLGYEGDEVEKKTTRKASTRGKAISRNTETA